jgi:hypothetical protein
MGRMTTARAEKILSNLSEDRLLREAIFSICPKQTMTQPSTLFEVFMMVFTFKGRPELVAARLAPIQVNFLVFPGTSG